METTGQSTNDEPSAMSVSSPSSSHNEESMINGDTSSFGETSDGQNKSKRIIRQQFTLKQRMDMYAFCVLELELNQGKVSICKQQKAIQKVLNAKRKSEQQQQIKHEPINANGSGDINGQVNEANNGSEQSAQQLNPPNTDGQSLATGSHIDQSSGSNSASNNADKSVHSNPLSHLITNRTLDDMVRELDLKTFSDWQQTQVLTSHILRDVQNRFAKYYPDIEPPSRTTIKHIFEKAVKHGTVENIKNPRKAAKIPHGSEIEELLVNEPQLSLRQLAQRLKVSTGTIARRCKMLGLTPDSVTIKHAQLNAAKREKQRKELDQRLRANAAANLAKYATPTPRMPRGRQPRN